MYTVIPETYGDNIGAARKKKKKFGINLYIQNVFTREKWIHL